MASKRRKRRHQCERKEKFEKVEAFRIAVRMRRTTGAVIDAYVCPFCGCWHVGKRPRKVQQRISAQRRERNKDK